MSDIPPPPPPAPPPLTDAVPPPAPQPPIGAPIPNYMAWSITMTVLCFLICCMSCYSFPGIVTGIIGIVYAAKVNSLLNAGDIAGATSASRTARILAWVTTAIFALSILIFLASLAFLGMDGYMEKIQEIQQQIESSR
jgi:hypothetical protein